MVVVSYSGKEINAKLVYYGPGLCGKTTNLEQIYKSVPSNSRGKMVSMKTRTERTLFFDFLPVDLGQLGGFRTRFLLYTVPGQVYYNATRKLVLRGVDAVVFVADSERGKMKENLESLQNLRDNLKDYDLDLDKLPWVIQYNKRDLEDVYSIEELEETLNTQGVPWFEAVAFTGEGVFETFRGVGKVLLQKLSKEVKLEEKTSRSLETAEIPGESSEAPSSVEPAAETPAASRDDIPAPVRKDAPAPMEPEPTPSRFSPETQATAPMFAQPATPTPTPPVEVAASVDPTPDPTPPSPGPGPGPGSGRKPETAPAEAPVAREPEPSAPRVEDVPEPSVAAVETAAPVARERFGMLDQSPSPSIPDEPEEESRGFFSKLLGRGKKPAAPTVSQETRATRVDIPLAEGSSHQGPVFIERRVQVPVSLSAEELVHGAVLRLVLEVKVEPATGSSDKDSRAA